MWRSILVPEQANTSAELRRTSGDARQSLRVRGLRAGYGKQEVLHDLDIDVMPGEIVCVLGHNGAGKTTLLRTLLGILEARDGTVEFLGRDVTNDDYIGRVQAGMTLTPAETPIFRDLKVIDNLDLGGFTITDERERQGIVTEILERFPLLSRRARQRAGTLSGGEQRILSIGMALAADPKLMMLDEPSLGIAPALVESIFQDIRNLAKCDGLSVLMVEQNIPAALAIADRVYFMRGGMIVLEETAQEAAARESWWDLF